MLIKKKNITGKTARNVNTETPLNMILLDSHGIARFRATRKIMAATSALLRFRSAKIYQILQSIYNR